MHWSAAYIGLPWQGRGLMRKGIDCWGLVKLVHAEVLSLDVPDDAPSMPWVKIDPAGAREFDVLMFCRGGLESHAGLVCMPGRMLHIDAGQYSEITSYVTGRWAPRLAGVYRHRARVGVMEA